jgi:hypothetical protein
VSRDGNGLDRDTREKTVEFLQATRAGSPREARKLLAAFLDKHYSGRELEDGPDFYMGEIAKFELMRACYHLGDLEAGDGVLAKIDPLHLLGGEAARLNSRIQWSIYSSPEVLTAKPGTAGERMETGP